MPLHIFRVPLKHELGFLAVPRVSPCSCHNPSSCAGISEGHNRLTAGYLWIQTKWKMHQQAAALHPGALWLPLDLDWDISSSAFNTIILDILYHKYCARLDPSGNIHLQMDLELSYQKKSMEITSSTCTFSIVALYRLGNPLHYNWEENTAAMLKHVLLFCQLRKPNLPKELLCQ